MIKMNFNQSERRLRLTVAVLLISVITMLPLGFSQTVKAQTPSKASARAESKGGRVEGIKVHGHWIIDVRNPDDTLVTHREFENALVPGNPLARILARQQTVGVWGALCADDRRALHKVWSSRNRAELTQLPDEEGDQR